MQAHRFSSVLPRQWSAAPACGARRPTEHRTHRWIRSDCQILQYPTFYPGAASRVRAAAQSFSLSPMRRRHFSPTSLSPAEENLRVCLPRIPAPRSTARAGCPHAWPDGAFREAGRTARPGRRRLPRRPLDALVQRWVAAAGRALRRRTGGAPPPLHAAGWPRRGRGVPNPNPVANRSP